MNIHSEHINITLLGCGKMGSAMMHGWLDADIIGNAHIYDPQPIEEKLSYDGRVTTHFMLDTLAQAFTDSDIIILAIKPQNMASALETITPFLPEHRAILSIAAGLDSDFFSAQLSADQPFIRVMPNLPCAVGHGMSALYANAHVNDEIKTKSLKLFQAIGDAFWIDEESQMNAITAISGSGPAYVFHMIEALSAAAQELGFSKDIADRLAQQTVIGAAALADQDREHSATTLRENVTSPGGTTEAGLEVLMNQNSTNLTELISDTAKAAYQRGLELGENK